MKELTIAATVENIEVVTLFKKINKYYEYKSKH